MAGTRSFLVLLGFLISALASEQLEQNATEVNQYDQYPLMNTSFLVKNTKTTLSQPLGELEELLELRREPMNCATCGFWVLNLRGERTQFIKYCDCAPGKECLYYTTYWGSSKFDRFKCQTKPTESWTSAITELGTTPVEAVSSRNDATTRPTSSRSTMSSEALTEVPLMNYAAMGSTITRPSSPEESTEASSEVEATTFKTLSKLISDLRRAEL